MLSLRARQWGTQCLILFFGARNLGAQIILRAHLAALNLRNDALWTLLQFEQGGLECCEFLARCGDRWRDEWLRTDGFLFHKKRDTKPNDEDEP
jgi:hypothetical protein